MALAAPVGLILILKLVMAAKVALPLERLAALAARAEPTAIPMAPVAGAEWVVTATRQAPAALEVLAQASRTDLMA